jgi:predicted AlkP superfamily phosphohydrolase/phosphomutase
MELLGELDARFGVSASKQWTYVSPWPSEPRTADMARGLVDGLRTRREAARWLLTERCPDWDLAIVVAGEPHSAAEAFWHGADADHPLHDLPSGAAAGQGLRDVYRETDRLVAELIDATAPQTVVVFSMGGMGPNNSDVASMVLLPELMYRWATAKEMLSLPREWTDDPTGVPLIPECQDWVQAMAGCYPSAREPKTRGLARRVARKLPANVRRRVVRALRGADFRVATYSVEWLPATRYRAEWPTMRAFALPSFYDGRVRVNVRGREPSGLVEPADYAATCDEIEALLTACRDPRTGEPVVARIERPGGTDPLALGSSYADLVIEWGSGACAFAHPNFGVIGPAPYRRTGGHTGPFGFAYLSGADIEPGDHGIRSAFDVSPTVATLLDTSMPPSFDGTSLLVEPV